MNGQVVAASNLPPMTLIAIFNIALRQTADN